VCLQFALFLLIGAGLAAFFAEHPTQAGAIKTNDHAFAYFIVHHLPTGLVGLTLAAVFSAAMSTLSGSLNSSATALVSDFIIPLRRQPLTESAQLRISKVATGLFGVLQIGIALATYWRGADELVVNRVLKIAAFTSGPTLGLYLLGVLAPRVRERAALGGFTLGLLLLSYLEFSTWPEWPIDALRWRWAPIYWPWYAAIGSIFTFMAGWLLSLTPLNAASSDQANDE
jgi:SSS family solute:Na+ symporter